jgi:endonuclease/exonuclease/phosphatase family metal-dependent hydrolase
MLAMSRVRVFLAVVAAVVFSAACGPFQRSGRGASGRSLRVVTYNIHAGHGDLARTTETIRALSPDMVALQEVDVHWSDRSGFVDQVGALASALGMEARFAPIYSLPNRENAAVPREFGVALLSRHHIASWRNDTLTRLSTQDSNAVPAPAPGLLEAVVDVRGSRVHVFNTHLDYRADPSVRRTQAREMAAAIARVDEPLLVFGDLNATPDAPELAPLFARLRDAWPADSGPGYTYPADKPTKRIDYVLFSREFRVVTARVPVIETSDHRPVVVDLLYAAPRASTR